ncbi:Rossmann-fold NAD(P)-binding domain-containing protein [Flindersiella endophytica]
MITVTGATGKLGRLVVAALLERGVPANQIVAAVRNPAAAADLAGRGVEVREADYDRPETLAAALVGTDRLLLISASEPGKRLPQHQNVIAAAVAAGVDLIAYTSILNAETTGVQLAAEHQATEAAIRESGLPYIFLRNGWYTENYTENLAPALEYKAVLGSAGDGRVAAAPRVDFAEAAAAVLAGDEQATNVAYELGGDDRFTMAEYAAEVSKQSGVVVGYQDLPADDYAKALVAAGLPEPFAAVLADSDRGIARGELDTTTGDLRRLIGRPTTPLAEVLKAALRSG